MNTFSVEDLQRQAEAGDAGAQFQLGMLALKQDDFRTALAWLHKAAEQKIPKAAEVIGTLLLTGQGVQQNAELAFEYFRSAGLAGDAQALYRCAELMYRGKEINQDQTGALDCLIASAQQGYPLALRAAAFFLCHQGKTQQAEDCLRLASYAGDPFSQHSLAVMLEERDPAEAMHWFGLAANAKLSRARVRFLQMQQNAVVPAPRETEDLAAIFQQLRTQLADLTIPTELADAEIKTLHASPKVQVIEQVFDPMELDYVIHHATPMLEPAQVVYDNASTSYHHYRTGQTAALGGRNLDIVLFWLHERITRHAGLSQAQAEPAAVIQYLPGQEYKVHLDILPVGSDFVLPEQGGQRQVTALLYLNDDMRGGDTAFPKLNLAVKPVRGSLLVFHNCDERGDYYPDSLHCGTAVEQGEKWVMSCWYRQFALPGRQS
ncbi:2OG-Fe(II) oxygenase [Rheinheimera mesophila]|nr:2OG-Fe(II) oxygenase [Rheinheimera mesophila]